MSKYHPINIGLSPNTEHDDIVLARKLLINPKHLIDGIAIRKLEEKMKETLGVRFSFAFRSGRSALYTAIKSINLKEGDEILLQTYTCSAVPNSVIWSGAKPTYVDIDPDTFNISIKDLERKINAKSRAIIVQHTFGLPANLKKIMAIAKRRGLIVIEDAAHALGATYEGKPIGTIGDMGIFSFGRDKVISGVCGGMLVTNSDAYAVKIRNIIAQDKDQYKKPSIAWTIQQIIHPIIMHYAILPSYGLRSIGKRLLAVLKSARIMPKVIHKAEKIGEKGHSFLGLMPNALAILALHQLRKLDKFNAHRKKIAEIYNRELKSLENKSFKLPIEEYESNHIYLRYTIKADRAIAILIAARAKNIILGDWYRPAIAPHGVSFAKMQYDPDTCPIAEEVSRKSLNLPTNINIKEADAMKIVEFIKKFLKKE